MARHSKLKMKVGFDMCTPKILFAGQKSKSCPRCQLFGLFGISTTFVDFYCGAIGGLCGWRCGSSTLSALRSHMPRGARLRLRYLRRQLLFLRMRLLRFYIEVKTMTPNQSPESTPIGALCCARTPVAHLGICSGWLSSDRCGKAGNNMSMKLENA